MEKNNDNNDKKAVSKAVAHEVESADVVFATSFLSPPPLSFVADIEHVKDKNESEEKEELAPDQETAQAKLAEPIQQKNEAVVQQVSKSAAADGPIQGGKTEKEEEKEEELKESSTVELLFACDAPETPHDEGDEESGAAGDGDGGGGSGDDNPVQKKEGNSIASGGSTNGGAVPADVMQKMESTLGADFSNVKINTNSSKATDTGALAFTQGNSIDFAPGQFNPNSKSGQELLGHELTHVVQQRQGRVKPTASINGMPLNDNAGLEKEADVMGAKAASSSVTSQLKKEGTSPQDSNITQAKIGPYKDNYNFASDESQPIQGMVAVDSPNAAHAEGENSVRQNKSSEDLNADEVETSQLKSTNTETSSNVVQRQEDKTLFEELSAESGNLVRSIAEISRLIPGLGVITGGLAQAINFEQDHTAAQEGAPSDEFLLFLVDYRNSINFLNGFVEDLLYLNQVVGDCGGHTTGITEVIGLVGGLVNNGLDGAQVSIDILTAAYTSTVATFPNAFDVNDPAVYEDFALGYTANILADSVGMVLGIIDTVTLATGQGSIADRLGDGFFAMTRLQQIVRIICRKAADPQTIIGLVSSVGVGVNGGSILDSVLGPVPDMVRSGVREGLALNFDQMVNNVETVWDFGSQGIDMMAEAVPMAFEMARAAVMELCDGVDPVIWIRDKMVEGVDEATRQGEEMYQNAQRVLSVKETTQSVMDNLDAISTEIENFELPTDIFPTDIEIGDNVVADAVEGVLETGAEAANETVNDIIAELQEQVEQFKKEALAKIKEAKDFAHKVYLVATRVSDLFLSAYRKCLEIIELFRARLAQAETLEDFLNVALGTVGDVLGLEGGLSVEDLKQKWEELKVFMDNSFATAREWINEYIRNQPAQNQLEESDPAQRKGAQEANPKKSAATQSFEKLFQVDLGGFSLPNKIESGLPFDLPDFNILNSDNLMEKASSFFSIPSELSNLIADPAGTLNNLSSNVLGANIESPLGNLPFGGSLQLKSEDQNVTQAKLSDSAETQPSNTASLSGPVQMKPSGANALPEGLQSNIEQNIGMSMSSVNIHTNSSEAKDVGALAFSRGKDIHFAPGQFNPGTSEGDHLIAHEAAHLTQKSGLKATTQVNGMPVNDDPGLEAEADAIADKVVQKKEDPSAESTPSVPSSVDNTIQRWEIPNPIDWATETYENASDAYNDAREEHYNRNENNVAPQQEPVDDDNWRLLPDSQSVYHQNGEEGRGNRKYVSVPDGNHEAVYDQDGNLVTDDANMGTYNHHGPDDTWGHFKEDVLPYWVWGNTEDDDTPLMDRLVGPRAGERLGEWAGDKWDGAKQTAGDAWDTVTETAGGAWEDVKETAGDAWDSVTDKASSAWESVTDSASGAWVSVTEGASNTWEGTKETASNVTDYVSDTASNAWDSVSDSASSAWDSVTDFFGGGDDPVQEKEDPSAKQLKAENTDLQTSSDIPSEGSAVQLKEEDVIPSGVNIHKESNKATEMGALAYAQGSDIHFAPGQFKLDTRAGQELLGHELGHVVQQKEGRVKPTTQLKGENVNNDSALEKEADDFGVKFADTLQAKSAEPVQNKLEGAFNLNNNTLQKKDNSSSNAPIQMQADGAAVGPAAGGGSSEGSGPISVDGSQAVVTDLMSSQPLPLFDKVKTAPASLNSALNSENGELSNSFPNIEQPTGLENQPLAEGPEVLGPQGPPNAPFNLEDSSQGGAQSGPGGNSLNVPHPGAFGPGGDSSGPAQGDGESGASVPEATAPSSTSVNIGEESVDFSAGQRPEMDLSGEADPGKMDTDKAAKTSEVQTELTNANQEINKDHGEDDIYPHYAELEQLTPQVEIPQSPTVEVPEWEELAERRGEVDAAFNLHAQAKLDEGMAEHIATNEAEVQKMNTGSQEEWTNYETEKTAEEARITEEQTTAQNNAKQEVATQQVNWQTENDAVKTQFDQDAEAEKSNFRSQIDAEIDATNADVENTLAQAESEAADKALEAEQDAREKEAEAEEKKNGGFFGWLSDKVSKAWNWLKDQFNAIIDALKQAVDFIIEKAKEAANALIELGRRAITGLIRAFGAALKLLVDIAFAAFPEIRDRIKGLIDQAVDTAVETVNQLADALKDIVSALLDALGAALKFLLDAYQKYINFLFDAIEFLAVGLYKIFKFITNLVVGAWKAPPQFLGCLVEDALGGNPGEPLKDIEVPNGQEDAWARAMGLAGPDGEAAGAGEEELSQEMIDLLTKGNLSDGDVTLEPNPAVELDEALLQQLAGLPDGSTKELGGAGGDSVTTEEFQAAAADSAGYDITGVDPAMMEQEALAAEGGEAGGEGAGPDFRSMTDEAKLQYYLDQMLPETEQAASQQPSPGAAGKEASNTDTSEAALIAKTGRLSTGERLGFMGRQMMTGMKVFWAQYKAWIIGALVTALIAAGAIAFFTGGAGLALAVDIILKAMMVIFGAIAIAKATGHVWEYVKHAWAGNTDAAGKSLAMACAVLVNEFLIDKILMGMGKVFRRTMKAIKASRVGRAAANTFKVVRKGTQGGSKVVRRGISAIKNSRLVVKMRSVIGKGVDNFMDLRRRILERFGFDRVWFEKVNHYAELWASFNPKLLLLRVNTKTNNLEVEELADDAVDSAKLNPTRGDVLPDGSVMGGQTIGKTGSSTADGAIDTVVVSDDYFNRLNEMTPDDLKLELERLQRTMNEGDFAEIRKLVEAKVSKFNRDEFLQQFPGGEKTADAIQSRSSLNTSVKNQFGDPPSPNHEAHHLIPVAVLKGNDGAGDLMRKAIDDGFEFNSASNGRWVSRYSSKNPADNPGLHASHPNYTNAVRDKLELAYSQMKKPIPDGIAKAEVERILREIGDEFDRNISASNPVKVDDLFTPQLNSSGQVIPGSQGAARRVDFTPSSGAELVANPEKTTTILGRWNPDMQEVKPKLHPHDHNIGMQHGVKNTNEGGFNFLNIPDDQYVPETFWQDYNMPWLTEAMNRGDDIVLATVPKKPGDIMDPTTKELFGMFAHEVKFLVDNNLRPTNVSPQEWDKIKSWF